MNSTPKDVVENITKQNNDGFFLNIKGNGLGVVVKKCICNKKICVCGSHGPKFLSQEQADWNNFIVNKLVDCKL